MKTPNGSPSSVRIPKRELKVQVWSDFDHMNVFSNPEKGVERPTRPTGSGPRTWRIPKRELKARFKGEARPKKQTEESRKGS